MTGLIEWLLGLEDIRLGRDVPLLLEWHRPAPAWLLLGAALVAVVAVALVYGREQTSARRRVVLAGIRVAVVALVVAALCQPALVLRRDRVEKSYVSLLVDTSLSMATREPYADESLGEAIARGVGLENAQAVERLGRLELVKAALMREDAAPLRKLLERNALQLSTFAGTVEARAWAASSESLETVVAQLPGLTAGGHRTDVASALARTIDDARGRRLAAVILATDGQSTEPTSLKDALDLAHGRQIPVYALRIGSPVRPCDVEVGPVRAEENVFVKDLVAVEVQLSARGLSEPTVVTVQLLDEQTGRTVATQEVTLDSSAASARVELTTKPERPGRIRYRVEAVPLPAEHVVANNVGRVDVRVLSDRLKVLYVDGYPRYEYRYLKNALLREESIDLSVLLIEADERFVQEGTDPIRRFPNTPEELNRFDVVLFGDVDPRGGWLTGAQMKMLLDFVGNHGGGFGLIAGPRATPHRFLNTPLEKLVPVRIDPQFLGHYETPLASGFRPQLTMEGERNRVFRWGSPEPALDTGKFGGENALESLPDLYWVARTLGPKPGASVLAQHPTWHTLSDRGGHAELMPLVVLGRYGAGKVFFQATDDTWRWRRHRGELLHDTYWVRVARELMRSDRLAQSRRIIIRTDTRVYSYGIPVQVLVEVFDPEILLAQPDAIEIVVKQQSDMTALRPALGAVQASSSSVVARFKAHRLGPTSARYEGTFIPPYPGGFLIQVAGLAHRPGEKPSSVLVYVERPDLEGRRPEANHEVLARVAEATGGSVIELDQLETAFAAVRDRSAKVPDDLVEPLWDSRLVLALFVLMISMEWILRKRFGLL